MDANAFLTGSRVYGVPNERSDVDVVVLVDDVTLDILDELADNQGDIKKRADSAYEGRQLMFGRLNLIVCTEELMFDAWLEGTRILIEEKPVSRERAIEVLRELRQDAAAKVAAGVGSNRKGIVT